MTASILVVDDESTTQDTLGTFLETEGYHVATARSGAEALTRIEAAGVRRHRGRRRHAGRRRARGPRAVPRAEPGSRGHPDDRATRRWRWPSRPCARAPATTCRSRSCCTISGAACSACCGAIPRPRAAARPPRGRPPLPSEDLLVGESDALRLVREQIARCAPAPSNVLITGESGTGKELVARAIHAASPRRHRPARGRELRRHPRFPAREPALRSRAGRLHQRRAGEPGPVRRRPRRHALPRRDRRAARVPPGEAPARHRGEAGVGRRGHPAAAGRRAHRRQHQP